MVCTEFAGVVVRYGTRWERLMQSCSEGALASLGRWDHPTVGRCFGHDILALWEETAEDGEFRYYPVPCADGWTEAREDNATVALAVMAVAEGPEYNGRSVRRALKSYKRVRDRFWHDSGAGRYKAPRASLAR